MIDLKKESLRLHKELGGKLKTTPSVSLRNKKDLCLVCNEGSVEAGRAIRENWRRAKEFTWRSHTAVVVSDGSHIHGSDNLGSLGALPVMEGKAALIAEIAGINAIPLTINSQDPHKFVDVIKEVSSTFGAVMLEDIEFPKCDTIRERLEKELWIPVFHNDAQVTAIVTLAGLLNALRVTGKRLNKAKIVIIGAGVAGSSVARLLHAAGAHHLMVCDDRGPVYRKRPNMNTGTNKLAEDLRLIKKYSTLADALKKADVVISLSGHGKLKTEHITSMANDAIIFALSRPVPEIAPTDAHAAGAKVVATGLFEHRNHIENAIVFPHLLRSMMEHHVRTLTPRLAIDLAENLAGIIKHPAVEEIVPDIFDTHLAKVIDETVKKHVPVFKKVKQAIKKILKRGTNATAGKTKKTASKKATNQTANKSTAKKPAVKKLKASARKPASVSARKTAKPAKKATKKAAKKR